MKLVIEEKNLQIFLHSCFNPFSLAFNTRYSKAPGVEQVYLKYRSSILEGVSKLEKEVEGSVKEFIRLWMTGTD